MILYKSNYLFCPLFCLLLCLLFSHTLVAQSNGSYGNSKGIIVSGKTGTSFLLTEINRDFSGAVSEFDNLPGLYTGMEVSHFFTPSLEAGGGVSYSILRGGTDTPDFSAIGYQHYLDEPVGPMNYNNRLFGPEMFARYYLGRNNLSRRSLNFFMKAGIGVLFYESELYFKERQDEEILFGKATAQFEHSKVANAVYILGTGLKYNLSELISVKFAANLNMVGYDFLDVVHNFKSGGERQEVVGMFTDITAGIAIKLGKEQRTLITGRGRMSADENHLPFSPMQ
jgi:hypothetical protein